MSTAVAQTEAAVQDKASCGAELKRLDDLHDAISELAEAVRDVMRSARAAGADESTLEQVRDAVPALVSPIMTLYGNELQTAILAMDSGK